jgi:hypothetical protein
MKCTTKLHIFQPLKPDEILSVVILPYVKFPNALRLGVLESPFVQFAIAADEGAGDPEAFDQSTLRWVFGQATMIVVCAGSLPSDSEGMRGLFERFKETLEPYSVRGGRVVLVNIELDDLDTWLDCVRDVRRPDTPVRLIVTPQAPEVMA